MTEKRLNTRVINKHDVEANWVQATEFTPMQGEIIIYDVDADHNYERMKIGDGETHVSALPFVSMDVITEEEIDEICGATIYAVNEVKF